MAFLEVKVTVYLQKNHILLSRNCHHWYLEIFYTGKEGPIYSVEWSPKSSEFCVVYGFMPSKATLFNLKCEPVFEFGTGPRNCIYYNPHGNNILLCALFMQHKYFLLCSCGTIYLPLLGCVFCYINWFYEVKGGLYFKQCKKSFTLNVILLVIKCYLS